jgi:trans-aconitate 2-methyltransferase
MSSADTWSPAQYNRFAAEREQPFWDLAALLEPVSSPALVDLGCGDGRLTAALHTRVGARSTVGIDSSEAMLASARGGGGLTFVRGDLATWQGSEVDIVFSNAALHWAPEHASVLERWRSSLAPGGQLAVQMPANADHPSHRVSRELAAEWLGAGAPPDPAEGNVLAPEAYAQLLDGLGFERLHVRLQVYPHRLDSSADVVEWVKGSSLTRLKPVFSAERYEQFVTEFRRRLLAEVGERSPYLYTFKRILMWGRLAG